MRHAAARAFVLGAMLWLASIETGHAQADPEVSARVIVDTASVRSGPGVGYRRVYTAHRDEVFPVRGRDTRGYWFRVELPDGTQGFVEGDALYNLETGEVRAASQRFLPSVFAPPPLMNAHGEVALVGGAFGSGGMLALRPTWLLDPTFGIEFTGAAAVVVGGRLLVALVGPVVNLFPTSPVVPFLTLAGGVVASSPSSDTFLLKAGSVGALTAGAGLRLGFRYRLTLRLEARTYVLFDANRYQRKEEFSAGLTVFF
jgi:hypothetical protein